MSVLDPRKRRLDKEEAERQELLAERLNPPFPYKITPIDPTDFNLLKDPPIDIEPEQ